MRLAFENASKEYLAQELEDTELALKNSLRLLQKQQQQQQKQSGNDDFDYASIGGTGGETLSSWNLPKSVQLAQLAQTTDVLSLAHAIIEWAAQAPITSKDDQEDAAMLIAQAEWCDQLGRVMTDYSNKQPSNSLMVTLYEEKYLPLYKYVLASLVKLLRSELEATQYPKKKGVCAALIRQCQTSPDTSAFAQACCWILRLQKSHQSVIDGLADDGNSFAVEERCPSMTIVRELLRPFVRRISFHFVETSPDRITTTRVDRLPEFLFNYLRENVLDGAPSGCRHDCPHGLIRFGLTSVMAPDDAVQLSLCFWQEIIQLIQWVLTERQFFRHPEIVGPQSNPVYLYSAVEQFLLFDRTLRQFAPVVANDQEDVLQGLMDILVMADDELCQWWIEREREAVFTILFEDDSTANVPKPLANHVSPRAEIFCALIRSVQWKASILTAPGIYLRNVAVPLCSQFVDALHDTSTNLRTLLCRPSTRAIVSPSDLVSNLYEWIEIINGTRLAANVLLREGAWQDGMPTTGRSDHDLARFGRSLERLVEVLVEELASSFVETLLMERAKFASYLMMASHLLATQEWDGDDRDLSAELKETRGLLVLLQSVCSSILSTPINNQEEKGPNDMGSDSSKDQQIAHFAPRSIMNHVFNRVADKFLEVALDIHDMAPDLWQEGAKIFARDVEAIVSSFSDLPLVRRLLDVTQLLTLDSGSTHGLMEALGGLVGANDSLDVHDFSGDETVYDQAVLMLKAKGFSNLELKDAISILNRRRD